MSNSYVLLEKVVVGSAGASSVTFANIPQTGYTDLVVKYSARVTASATFSDLNIRFNSSTSGYSERMLYGNSTSAASAATSGSLINWGASVGSTATSSTFSNGEIYLPNYTGSNNKSMSQDVVTENNSGATNSVTMNLHAALWSNAAAITSIDLIPSSGTFVANSTFYLYGVAKLGTTPTIAPKATGGDVVMTDGTYWYHAFRSSGTFTPALALSCDVLVAAGGASGGENNGGGGGAGGVLAFASQSISTASTVTVGAGGAGLTGSGTSRNGNAGSNSQFASLTAAIGGGKGGGYSGNGSTLNGGNGGGAGQAIQGAGSTSGGTGSQGFNGGGATDYGNSFNSAGGGGGAGANGVTGVSNQGGNGGAGVNTVTNWGALSSVLTNTGLGVSGYIAGGGGGSGGNGSGGNGNNGAGGSGGGGAAASSNAGAGTANTGSGGGGVWTNGGNSGAGGSGIVIVRYLVA
jgi:hypothetical protein